MRGYVQRALAMTPLLIGLGGGVLVTNPAWAGADDGGNKAFFAIPGPGASVLGPAPPVSGAADAPQPASGVTARGRGATATVNAGAYESYRNTYRHRNRFAIQPQ